MLYFSCPMSSILKWIFLEILLPLYAKTSKLLYISDIFLSCAHIFVCSCNNVVIMQGQGGLLRGHCVEQSLCIATRWWSWWLMDTFSFHLCIRRSDDGYWMTIYEQRTFSYILYWKLCEEVRVSDHPPLSYLGKVIKTRCFSSPSTFLLEKIFILGIPFLI